jgi:electron transfer flavoprotein alpha subunit
VLNDTIKDASVFQKCDDGIIGDLFDVVPILTETLEYSGKGKTG